MMRALHELSTVHWLTVIEGIDSALFCMLLRSPRRAFMASMAA
jgi:hypothetical protein